MHRVVRPGRRHPGPARPDPRRPGRSHPSRGAGCPECGDTGYRGRTAVYEVLVVNAAMRKVLLSDPSESAIGAAVPSRRRDHPARVGAGQGDARRDHLRGSRSGHPLRPRGDSACPVCERKVETGMLVCPWCTATLDRGHCSVCAKQLDTDWKICPWCRTPAPTVGLSQRPAPAQRHGAQADRQPPQRPVQPPAAAFRPCPAPGPAPGTTTGAPRRRARSAPDPARPTPARRRSVGATSEPARPAPAVPSTPPGTDRTAPAGARALNP